MLKSGFWGTYSAGACDLYMNFPLLLFPLIYFVMCYVQFLWCPQAFIWTSDTNFTCVWWFLSKQATRFCPFAKNAGGKDFFFFISGLCFGGIQLLTNRFFSNTGFIPEQLTLGNLPTCLRGNRFSSRVSCWQAEEGWRSTSKWVVFNLGF